MQKLLHSISETGDLLGGVNKNLLYRFIREGELEVVKLGRRSLITRESVEAFIARQRAKPLYGTAKRAGQTARA